MSHYNLSCPLPICACSHGRTHLCLCCHPYRREGLGEKGLIWHTKTVLYLFLQGQKPPLVLDPCYSCIILLPSLFFRQRKFALLTYLFFHFPYDFGLTQFLQLVIPHHITFGNKLKICDCNPPFLYSPFVQHSLCAVHSKAN